MSENHFFYLQIHRIESLLCIRTENVIPMNCHIYREILRSSRFAGNHFHRHLLVSDNIWPSAAALLLPSSSFALSRKGDFR
jgi:hypothetical protein